MVKPYTWTIANGCVVTFEIIEGEGPDTEHIIVNIPWVTPGVSELDVYQAVLDYYKLYFPNEPNLFKEAIARLNRPTPLYKTRVEVVIYSNTAHEQIDDLFILPNQLNMGSAVKSISNQSIDEIEMIADFEKLGISLDLFPEVAKKYPKSDASTKDLYCDNSWAGVK